MSKRKTKQPAGSPAATGYVPQFLAREAFGNHWVKDVDNDRIVCMCTRKEDSEMIAAALNGNSHNTGGQP